MPVFFVEKIWEAFALLQKLFKFFQQKISIFGYKVAKHLTSWPLNELVKLMMLWKTGPSCFETNTRYKSETMSPLIENANFSTKLTFYNVQRYTEEVDIK